MTRVALWSRDGKLQPLLAPALGREYQVITQFSSKEAGGLGLNSRIDVALLDIDSEFGNPEQQIQLYAEISKWEIPVVVLTDDIARPIALDLVQRGAHGYCRKPPALLELRNALQRACEHAAMRRQLEARSAPCIAKPDVGVPLRCDALIGSSPEMQAVYNLIRRVALLNNSVLITGESGTGKELIARAIHNLGERPNAPFVAVSCGAIPETLIESELFGHEKGAFTGTIGSRIGYFEQAANGTLFLDEIGELSLQTQVKLLRALQMREFTRLGSGRPIPLKARVLFATHRDLSRMIAENTFRLDLYYRINVMTIKSPSLSAHPEDIPVLVDAFLKQYAEIYNKPVSALAPEALALLQEYDWPGNVRELENVIQSAIICADAETIESKDLPERFQQPELKVEEDVVQAGTFERMLRDFKIKIATKAIEDCNGNKTMAARNLNISRAYLHRLIRVSEGFESEADVA